MAVERLLSLELLRELLSQGHTVPVRYTGKSMVPTFAEGDELLVRAPGVWPIPTGSVVVFEENKGLTTHRVAWRVKQRGVAGYVTRGDAFFVPDPFLNHAKVVGVVAGFVRKNQTFALDSGWQPLKAFFKSKYLPWKVRGTLWLKRLL